MDVVVGLGEYSEARSRPGGAEPSVDGSEMSEGTVHQEGWGRGRGRRGGAEHYCGRGLG